jgi:hypothetical protein
LSSQNDAPNVDTYLENAGEQERALESASAIKKPFVEPAISLPIDVFEATAFFGSSTVSGGTIP